jgi:flagellar basal body-associated protein FliL
MRDRRLISLLVVVLIVVTVSFILVSFWGYRYYFERKEAQRTTVTQPKQPVDPTTSFSDSLQNLLNLAAAQVQDSSDSISLDSTSDTALASKLVEFNRLRNEITEMIRNKDASKNSAAENERIDQMEQTLEALKTRNDEVAAENVRLANMVKQLMQTKGKSPASKSGKHLASSAYTLPVLVAHLRFVGMSLGDNRSITNIAAKTERLYGSFEINIKPGNKDNTIYIVIVQPDGKTLIAPGERSGTFTTDSETKPFSTSIKFDNKRDNGNRLVFTIDSHNFQKGTYAMQIYHQGQMIGRLTRTLF